MNDKLKVLVLCTGNSCRSQMAEAFLRRHGGERIEAFSAGLSPKPIHPLTLQVLHEVGIDTSNLHSKPLKGFLGRESFQYAIIVCEQAQQNSPRIFPSALNRLYWPFEDPAACGGMPDEVLAKFRDIRDQIEHQVITWLEGIG